MPEEKEYFVVEDEKVVKFKEIITEFKKNCRKQPLQVHRHIPEGEKQTLAELSKESFLVNSLMLKKDFFEDLFNFGKGSDVSTWTTNFSSSVLDTNVIKTQIGFIEDSSLQEAIEEAKDNIREVLQDIYCEDYKEENFKTTSIGWGFHVLLVYDDIVLAEITRYYAPTKTGYGALYNPIRAILLEDIDEKAFWILETADLAVSNMYPTIETSEVLEKFLSVIILSNLEIPLDVLEFLPENVLSTNNREIKLNSDVYLLQIVSNETGLKSSILLHDEVVQQRFRTSAENLSEVIVTEGFGEVLTEKTVENMIESVNNV